MDQVRKFRETLTAAYRRLNALQRAEKCCYGVTMSQCVTLETLHQQGRMPIHSLAEQLGLESSTMTRVVDVLERDGRVRRVRDESGDRRRVFVLLTSRGRSLAGKLEDCADVYCERILARIPPDRRDEVLQSLALLVEALDDPSDACCPS